MRFLLSIAALCVAGSAHAWSSPQAAIEQFVKFETEGGRLQAWQAQNYLAVDANYEEPGWDEVHVVESFHIDKLRCDGERCRANVTYTYVPTAKLGLEQIAAHPTGGSEQVEYVAVQRNGSWLLESSKGKPHVTLAALKQALSGL